MHLFLILLPVFVSKYCIYLFIYLLICSSRKLPCYSSCSLSHFFFLFYCECVCTCACVYYFCPVHACQCMPFFIFMFYCLECWHYVVGRQPETKKRKENLVKCVPLSGVKYKGMNISTFVQI